MIHGHGSSSGSATTSLGALYDYSRGSASKEFDTVIGEGVRTMVDINTQLSNERAAANAMYENLASNSLLKKFIDLGVAGMPTGDYDPQSSNEFLGVNFSNGYRHDYGNNQSYRLFHGSSVSSGILARFENITSGDYSRVGYLSDYGETFTLASYTPTEDPFATVDNCLTIRSEKRQWNENAQLYSHKGVAFKVGNFYSNAQNVREMICELGIFEYGNSNLIANDKLITEFENMVDPIMPFTMKPPVFINSLNQ